MDLFYYHLQNEKLANFCSKIKNYNISEKTIDAF